MKRMLLVLLLCWMVFLGFQGPTVSASPPGFISNPLSALIRWIWTLPGTTPKADRHFLQFEPGYMVETVLEGNKLGIDPYTIEVSPDGELLVLDSVNSNILRITPPLSRYSRARLVAGSLSGYSGHVDGRPKDSRFNHPKGFTVDDKGNIYVADTMNMAIRKIGEAGVTTIAGGRSNRGGHVDGPSEDAKFSSDFDVVYVGSTCSLLVVDRGNQAIREIPLHYDDCAYNYGTNFSSAGILMVVVASILGYVVGWLQQGFGTSIFSKSEKQDKPSKKRLAGPAKTDRAPFIPVEGQSENVDAGWMSFGKFILDLTKLAAEIIGGIFFYLRDLITRTSYQKKGDSWPLQGRLFMQDDGVEPQQISRNPKKKGDLWPLQDSLPIPDEDLKLKTTPLNTRTVAYRETEASSITSIPSKVTQNLQARSPRDFIGSFSSKGFNNHKEHEGKDQNHLQPLRHHSSFPRTYYERHYESSNEVVFGAVQEARGRNENVEIKPVDYGDPMYDHYNIRGRVGFDNLFDF